MLIVLASYYLNFVLSILGIPQQLAGFITGLGLSPTGTIILIVAFFVVLGCFLESLSMLVATTPLIVPIVVSLGYDPVWFGVMMVILLEVALITPPVGINLFVVQSIRKDGQFSDVIIGALPFVLCMFALLGLMIAFPLIALYLPAMMK
jgi:TRAP-type C4-dicarboxylate transport system permease large subunit